MFEMLTTLVAQVKGMTPGASMVVPGGFKGGYILYVLHCDSFEEFTVAVCCTAEEGLAFHPARIDPATGSTQFNTPLLIRKIGAQGAGRRSVADPAPRGRLRRREARPAQAVYTQILPYLNGKPLLANLPSSAAAGGGGGGDGGGGAPPRWGRRRRREMRTALSSPASPPSLRSSSRRMRATASAPRSPRPAARRRRTASTAPEPCWSRWRGRTCWWHGSSRASTRPSSSSSSAARPAASPRPRRASPRAAPRSRRPTSQ